MAKWLKAFGFAEGGDEHATAGLTPEQRRRVMRLRETMRWRGYDLEPYTDDQIIRAADALGAAVSATGETTEASREALFEAIRSGLGAAPATQPEAPPAADEAPSDDAPPPPPPVLNPFEHPAPIEPETASVAERPKDPAPDGAAEPAVAAATTAPSPPGLDPERTPLVRLRHIFGAHTWIPHQDEQGPYLHCPGCHTDRRGYGAAREAQRSARRAVPRPDQHREARLDDEPEDGSPRSRPERAPEPGTATALLKWYFGSPWWVKALSIFVVLQVVTVVVSAFGG